MSEESLSCSGCGRKYTDHQFPFGLSYCPYCGQKLTRPEPRQSLSFCPYCGHQNTIPDADFCASCGKKWGNEQPIIPPVADLAEVNASDSSQKEPSSGLRRDPAPERTAEPMDFSGYGVGYAPYYHSKPGVLEKITTWLKSSIRRGMTIIGDYVSGRYRVKKLYDYWTSHSELPAESLPSSETIEQLARESGADNARPLRISLVILAFIGIIIVFVGVGLLIRSC